MVERVAESAGVVSLRLAAADGTPLPAASPGQFLTVRLHPLDGRPDVTRTYSLSGRPGAADYRISVKREPHGVAGELVHAGTAVGATLEVAAPRGTFTLEPGDRPVLLISAGIGVTPLLAMLHALADAAPSGGLAGSAGSAGGSARQVWWLHGARDGGEHPFAVEAAALLARLPDTRVAICFSAPSPGDRVGADYTRRGRLSADVLADLHLPADADAYVCGPASFMADVRGALIASGLAAGRIRSEAFGAGPALTPGIVAEGGRAPHPPSGPSGTGPAVTFARSGLTVNWRPADTALLDLAEACDVPVRWSCRTGVCHNCETALLDGAVAYAPPPLDPPATGNVLLCCAAPSSDVVLDL